ncbi:MAG: inosine/xanthosine triphosphatase [Nitrososphaerota archaeon]|jgi:inosine/xanthosine triphosphatase|nr:inosine/xanthosine triphosphatase [Nitrososphaerota archaeon]MDG6927058.1 inosine/xanthosine triphosphatase [Nitrososphaerota archaeon]MDG6930558.1 inosine/xanthosine triphosphatase [Nitrososphaerota archaeon]MDG6932375.1 inosine/xanthosine triphosphatase [Nitrososphaerota archaeon]MDG6935934.1 inosine/xanthosine triphosphatase [Nitrososphaerota archaeon]
MIIAVGSGNVVKIEAVKNVFRTAFGATPKIVSIEVESGVPAQPFNNDLLIGARNRAKKALDKAGEAEFGIGIEGGGLDIADTFFVATAVCIIRKDGAESFGMTGSFMVPESVESRMKGGEELGDVMDSIIGKKGTKRGIGAIGYYSKGLMTREGYLEQGVFMALVKFIGEDRWR